MNARKKEALYLNGGAQSPRGPSSHVAISDVRSCVPRAPFVAVLRVLASPSATPKWCHVFSSSTFHGSIPKLTSSEEQSDYLKKEHTSLFERSPELKIGLRMKILGNFRAQMVRVF